MSHPSLSESSSESGSSGRAAIAEEEEVEVDESSAANEDSSSGDGPSNSRQRRDSGDSWSSGIPEGPDIDEEDMETLYMNNPRDEMGIPDPVVRPVRAVIGPRSRPREIPEVRPPMEVPSITGQTYVPVQKKAKIIRPQSSKESCKLIVDYLISEGYKEVAETLCREAEIEIPVAELRHLDGRVAIRDAIVNGRIEEAIKMVKTLCPGLLESHADVRFNLHQQLMIELIRVSSIDEVLKYAEKHISQDDKLLPDQLDRLERTFALLAFDNPKESPFSNLLSGEHRQQISTEINAAILRYQNRPAVPRLEALLRMIIWAEKQVYEKEQGRGPLTIDTAKLSALIFNGMNLIPHLEGSNSDLGTSI